MMKLGDLQHHGVLGMRWGVRKDRRSSRTRAQQQAASVGRNIASIDQMSNKDMQDLLNRLNMERQLQQIGSPVISRGQQILKDSLQTVLKAQIIKYGNMASSAAIDAFIAKMKKTS